MTAPARTFDRIRTEADLRATSPAIRLAAVERLSDAPPEAHEDARAWCGRMLDDPDARVRAAACDALAALGPHDELGSVLRRIDEDADPRVRQCALLALVGVDDPRVRPTLVRALSSPHPDVRFQALPALARTAPDEALAPLRTALSDSEPEVRAYAATCLAELGAHDAADAIAALLGDAVPATRFEAALALAELRDSRAREPLIEALRDARTRFDAATALGLLGDASAADALFRAAPRWWAPLLDSAAAGAALVRLGDPRGTELLRRCLRAWRPDARNYAAMLVGELRIESLVPELVGLIRRPRGAELEVVVEALHAMEATSDPARLALDELRKNRKDWAEFLDQLRLKANS